MPKKIGKFPSWTIRAGPIREKLEKDKKDDETWEDYLTKLFKFYKENN